MEGNMRFHEKHFEIPQVCLDLGFEDRSHRNELLAGPPLRNLLSPASTP